MKRALRQGILWLGTAVIAVLVLPTAALLGSIFAVSALVDHLAGRAA